MSNHRRWCARPRLIGALIGGVVTACGGGSTASGVVTDAPTGGSGTVSRSTPYTVPGSGTSANGSPGAGASSAPSIPDTSPGTIAKVFSLTINGTPRQGEAFAVSFDAGTGAQQHPLCGSDGVPACGGNGQQVSTSVSDLQPRSGGRYTFIRMIGGSTQSFFSGTDPMTGSSVVTAYFNE